MNYDSVRTSGWKSLPLRRLVKSVESGVSVNATDVPPSVAEPGVLKTSSVYSGSFDASKSKVIDDDELGRAACHVRADRLIVSRMNTPELVGMAGYSEFEIKNRYLPDRLWQIEFHKQFVDTRFIHRWTQSSDYRAQVRAATAGTSSSMHNLAQDEFRSFVVPLPSVGEQRQIAEYLDRETGKIDELITKQEQLVATLAERRQTLISLTVCSGLGPPASVMTGNSWFPVIPHDWKVGAIKHYARRITDGAHISPDTEGGIYDFVSTKDVTPSGIHFDGALKTTRETYEYMVKTGCQPALGDLLLSKDGTIGRTTVVVEDRDFVVASSLIIISPDVSRLNSMFLNYLCQSSPVQEQIRSFVKGAGLPRLSIANLLRVVGLIPPMEKQLDVVEYLDRKTAAISALVESAVALISLMRERRAALISAAVTGRIDVRGQ